MRYAFEEYLPLPVEEVHAAFVPLPGHRVLACGIDRERVRCAVLAGASALTPESIPAWIDAAVKPESIGLLTGEFEPASLRRQRRATRALVVASVLVCAGLVITGFERRRVVAELETIGTRGAVEDLISAAVPPGRGTASQPPQLRLTAELRKARAAAAAGAVRDDVDVTASLEAVLRAWPRGIHHKTDMLSVTGEAVTVSVALADTQQAQAFTDALGMTPGWELQQPQIAAAKGGVQAKVLLRAQGAGR